MQQLIFGLAVRTRNTRIDIWIKYSERKADTVMFVSVLFLFVKPSLFPLAYSIFYTHNRNMHITDTSISQKASVYISKTPIHK